MKILFIYRGTESLGIEYLSSFLKSKGHETSLLFDPAVFQGDVFLNIKSLAKYFNIDKLIVKKAIELNPDVVAFSSYTGNYLWCLDLARSIKQKSDIKIVFGGVHPTAVPERVLNNDFIDFVVMGEGELAMLDLINHLARNESKDKLINTPNICFKHGDNLHINKPRPYIRDLDSLPFPDKQLFLDREPLLKNNPYFVLSSRGCPYNCTYCSNSMYKKLYSHEKKHVRRRSPDNVIEELLSAKKKWNIEEVYFADDVFTSSRTWLADFIKKYKSQINLPFFCYVHPLSVTKEIASLLKEGGCVQVGVGVQSGSERIRKDIYNRRESNERIIKAISDLKSMNLIVIIDHIFGAPSEIEEDLEKSADLYRKLKPDNILTCWMNYYPKIQIIESALKEGIISEKDVNDIEEGYIGYTHDFGSVDKKNIPMFQQYELLLKLSVICRNDRLYSLLCKIVPFIPFKKKLSLLIYFINSVRCLRRYTLNKITYAFSRHKKPV